MNVNTFKIVLITSSMGEIELWPLQYSAFNRRGSRMLCASLQFLKIQCVSCYAILPLHSWFFFRPSFYRLSYVGLSRQTCC